MPDQDLKRLFKGGRTKLLFPSAHVSLDFERDGPLFFLAGPVRGGGDWQMRAAILLATKAEEDGNHIQVAIPYYHRADKRFDLMDYAHDFGRRAADFPRQRDWEQKRILQAMKHGCLLFWLPVESEVDPRPDGHYACDTRGELGRYSMHRAHDPALRMVVGGEREFPGFDLIVRNQFHDWLPAGLVSGHETDYVVPHTLGQTVDAAYGLAFAQALVK